MEKAKATPKILSYAGLAVKAGKAVSGSAKAEAAIKSEKAHLVLISGNAGKNTLKHFSDMAAFRNIPCIVLDDDGCLGMAVGKENKKTVCITDAGFAAAIEKEINLYLGGKQ